MEIFQARILKSFTKKNEKRQSKHVLHLLQKQNYNNQTSGDFMTINEYKCNSEMFDKTFRKNTSLKEYTPPSPPQTQSLFHCHLQRCVVLPILSNPHYYHQYTQLSFLIMGEGERHERQRVREGEKEERQGVAKREKH